MKTQSALIVIVALLATGGYGIAQTVHDAAADWSTEENPNGNWEYLHWDVQGRYTTMELNGDLLERQVIFDRPFWSDIFGGGANFTLIEVGDFFPNPDARSDRRLAPNGPLSVRWTAPDDVSEDVEVYVSIDQIFEPGRQQRVVIEHNDFVIGEVIAPFGVLQELVSFTEMVEIEPGDTLNFIMDPYGPDTGNHEPTLNMVEVVITAEEQPIPDPVQTYYRFEDDLVDDVSGAVHGTTDAAFSEDVPFGQISGQPNTKSLSFSDGSSARFNGSPFIFHNGIAATLEWFMKPTDQLHVGLFWTIDAPGDANRYNIHFQSPGIGADYREEGGDLHTVLDGNVALPFDEWSHIACVRTILKDGGHLYDWYVNGELMNTAVDATPLPPTATTWTISGRDGCCNAFNGLIDEVRMTPDALTPDQFLSGQNVCEPTEDSETVCDDGVDNDCDDLTDNADGDCQGIGPFIRGDCDHNGTVGGSPTEAIVLLNFSFRGGEEPACLAACDAEANGSIGITDALRILRHAFLGLGEPDPPFPDCTKSNIETDAQLGCETPFICP